MTTIKIQVKRAQAFASLRDGGSYNYQYSQIPPTLESADSAGWNLRVPDQAKEKFFQYVETGKKPDFSKEIGWANDWLKEHGHKGGDWQGMIDDKKAELQFLNGGFVDVSKKIQPVTVEYFVETLPPYALGTFQQDSGEQKWMPFKSDSAFIYKEVGYKII